MKKVTIAIGVVILLSIIVLYYNYKNSINEDWNHASQLFEQGDYEEANEILTYRKPRNEKEEKLNEMLNMVTSARTGLYSTENVFGPDEINVYTIEDSLEELITGYPDLLDNLEEAKEKKYKIVQELRNNKFDYEMYLDHYFELTPTEAIEMGEIRWDDEEEYKQQSSEAIAKAKGNQYSYPPSSNWKKDADKEFEQNNPLVIEDSRYKYNSSLNRYEVTGTVHNRGEQEYTFIQIKLKMLDEKGNIVDTHTEYVNSSDALLSDERKRFEIAVYTDVDFDTIEEEIYDYN